MSVAKQGTSSFLTLNSYMFSGMNRHLEIPYPQLPNPALTKILFGALGERKSWSGLHATLTGKWDPHAIFIFFPNFFLPANLKMPTLSSAQCSCCYEARSQTVVRG